ncbi:MAG: ATP-binding protein [Candidatus Altiarchaeota archaeon]
MVKQTVKPQEPGAPQIPRLLADSERLDRIYPSRLGVIVLDNDGEIVAVNSRAAGWGRKAGEQYLDDDLVAEGRDRLIARAREGVMVSEQDLRHHSRRRGDVTQDLTVSPVFDTQNRGLAGTLVMITDTTYASRLREIREDIASDRDISSILGKIVQYAAASLMESESNPRLKAALRLTDGDSVVGLKHYGPWTVEEVKSLYLMEAKEPGKFRALGPVARKTMTDGSIIIPDVTQSTLVSTERAAERGITSLASYRIGNIGTLTVYNFGQYTHEERDFHEALAREAYHAIRETREHTHLSEALGRLEADMLERENFTSALIHDVRGPINTVIGFLGKAEVDVGVKPPENVRAQVTQAKSSATRALELVEATAHDIRSGKMGLNLEECSVGDDLVSPTLDSVSALAREKRISFSLSIPDDVPHVRADRVKVSMQVLGNLVGNALKYTPERETIEISAQQKGLSFVELSVKNPGPSIPVDKQASIFEAGVQVDEQRDRALADAGTGLGVGLGLSTAKRVVESHGGQIRVLSAESIGTIFSFTLPAVVEYPEIQLARVLGKFIPLVDGVSQRQKVEISIEASRQGDMVPLIPIRQACADMDEAYARLASEFKGEHEIKTDELILSNTLQVALGATMMDPALGLQKKPEGHRRVSLSLSSDTEHEIITVTGNGESALDEQTRNELNIGVYKGEEHAQLFDAMRGMRGDLIPINAKMRLELPPEGGSRFVISIPKKDSG